MATYAIGDIQGCYQTLQKLLNQINFHPQQDHLWLAGDLINRGADSLKTLEFAFEHRDHIRCVLGNHDLHFLAIYFAQHSATKKDTLDQLLQAPNCAELAHWLIQQPLFYYDARLNFAMAHAGIHPHWTLQNAIDHAKQVTDCLQSAQRTEFFQQMYGNLPEHWNENLAGMERLRFITNVFTRMRYCQPDGGLELTCKLPPGEQPAPLTPWFEMKSNFQSSNLVFGHWASLQGQCHQPHWFALDTGCVWGGQLTALRLDDQQLFHCDSVG